ncbi:hypothetical protein G6F31_018277 [Rhizopus arrhizus]|nr:hypothetical protein G6F31_018277 [Rhizopus arrhizus]
MVGQRKVRRGITQGDADGDAFGVQRVGHAADRGLRAFVVDVPLVEVLQRAGVHHDERRVDDRAGIHQRTGQAVLDGFDGRIGLPQQRQGFLRQTAGEYARGQAGGVAADHHPVAVLAGQVGQRAGFRIGDAGRIARVFLGAGEEVAAEGARRQEHDLSIAQQRAKRRRQRLVRRGG